MMLKSFSFFSCLIFIIFNFSLLKGEDKIDIWKNNEKDETSNTEKIEKQENQSKTNINRSSLSETKNKITIEDSMISSSNEEKVFGVYDPANNNFNLNMWSTTKAEDIRSSLKRIKKIKLSRTSNEILGDVLLSYSYPPEGMEEKEFVSIKLQWLINNNQLDLIESFLKSNKEFDGKKKAVQFLVDHNIAQANINEGCKKIEFIDSTIKDAYLEKFKIYCLVFNNKKSEAQLLYDLLKEQGQSDKFFDDKISFLLGISDKTSNKINEKNLLNFYLSSITTSNFDYTPSKKTKKEIWKYLNAANLIRLDDIENKEKIKELEIAASQGQVDSEIIFNIYKQIPFNLNTLINANNLYQTLSGTDARSLIYQKYLLSENINSKIEFLFLLDELFKKDQLQSIFNNILIKNLKDIGLDNIPEEYKEIADRKISSQDEKIFKKIKFNDKILHQSKIIKFYLEDTYQKKNPKRYR